MRRWDSGQAAWLRRLAAPLPSALSGDLAEAVRAVQALAGFDPLADLPELAPGDGEKKSSDPAARAPCRRPFAADMLPRKERPAAATAAPAKSIARPWSAAAPEGSKLHPPGPAPTETGSGVAADADAGFPAAASRRLATAAVPRAGKAPASGQPLSASAAEAARETAGLADQQAEAPISAAQRLAALRRERVRERQPPLRSPTVERVAKALPQAAAPGASKDPGDQALSDRRVTPVQRPASTGQAPASVAEKPSVPGSVPPQSAKARSETVPSAGGRRESAPGSAGTTASRQAPVAVTIDRLDPQVQPAPVAPRSPELRVDDSLAQQLADAAYRHGLDLT